MTGNRFKLTEPNGAYLIDNDRVYANWINDDDKIIDLLNTLNDENEKLKSDLKDCRKLKTKRLNKIRNHRAVIEDLGGSIRAYKGKIEQTNEKIDKIKEAMEDTGALTKRQLEEILNDWEKI
jgi:chromosome segregation ATPase